MWGTAEDDIFSHNMVFLKLILSKFGIGLRRLRLLGMNVLHHSETEQDAEFLTPYNRCTIFSKFPRDLIILVAYISFQPAQVYIVTKACQGLSRRFELCVVLLENLDRP